MADPLDFDPTSPVHCSVFVKKMRETFASAAPKQYEDNEELWKRLEKSVFAANTHSIGLFKKDAKIKLEKLCEMYEGTIEDLNSQITLKNGELVRCENQVNWWRGQNENLKVSLDECKSQIESLESRASTLGIHEELKAKKEKIEKRDKEIEELRLNIKRHEMKVEFIELEKRGAMKYAELQVSELQKELVRMRMKDFERNHEKTSSQKAIKEEEEK